MASKNTCTVCHDDIEIFAIGQCDHPVCYKCCTRMRLLCDQQYCAICRTDLTQVMFARQVKKYAECVDRFKLKKDTIFFENDKVQSAFYDLIGHRCKFCKFMKPLKTFRELEQHMRREHSLNFCDICVKHLKVFTYERKSYDRETLARHRRIGDADDKSFKGHPLCELCDQRYLDRDELHKHCRKEHFYCHFCETDGRPLEFFDEYRLLADHFREYHHLCEEGECWNVQHTNAFRSEIDLKAHRATVHSKAMKKAEARQARTIEVDITLAPRQSYTRGRGGHGRHRDMYDRGEGRRDDGGVDRDAERNYRRQQRQERETAEAVAFHLNEIHRQSGSVAMVDRNVLDAKWLQQPQKDSDGEKYKRQTEDFPTLDGKKSDEAVDSDDDRKRKNGDKDTLAKKLARASNFSVQDGTMEEGDFPSLGGKSRKSKSTQQKGVWQQPPETSDYPSLPSKKAQPAVVKKPTVTQPSHVTNSQKQPDRWAHSVGKPTQPTQAPPQHCGISVTISDTRPTSKPASQNPQTLPNKRDFPSLSSIGNSLLNHKPNAPGLSLTRSSTWAGGGHAQPMEKQTFTRPGPPVNFAGDDFPSLGGGSSDSLNQWNAKPGSAKPSGPKKGSRKQPAPMPDFASSYSDSELPSKKATKADFKLEDSWDTVEPKKKAKEDKQSSDLVKLVEQQTKSKKKANKSKGKKSPTESTPRSTPDTPRSTPDTPRSTPDTPRSTPDTPRSTPDISDKDSDSEATRDKKKSQKSGKTKADPPKQSKIDIKTYKADPPREVQSAKSSKADPPKEVQSAKSSKTDPPKEVQSGKSSKADSPREVQSAKSSKANPPKKNKQDIKTYKVDLPKDANQNIKSYKADPPKDSKQKIKNYKPDPPKESEKNVKKSKSDEKTIKTDPPKDSKPEEPRSEPSSDQQTLQPKDNNFPSLSELSETSSIIQSLTMNDFPSLGSAIGSSSMSSNPPPGFKSTPTFVATSRPPPGLPPGLAAPPPLAKPPPGFIATPVENIENIAPFNSLNGNLPTFSYAQPNDFKSRNQKLILDIKDALTSEQFEKFKLCSGEFRQGQISGSEYYKRCGDMMGGGKFELIFPQLLSLLPDIDKQQELLTAHNISQAKPTGVVHIGQSGKRGWKAGSSLFTTCTTCQQVVLNTDLADHMNSHSTDMEFPALGSMPALASWGKK